MSRSARVERVTRETQILVELDLDGALEFLRQASEGGAV